MLNVDIQQFSYPNASETLVLENIAFSLQAGEHLAVLGESGCGKTSLLHLIYGLLHLEHGTLFWEKKQLLGPQHNLVPGEPFMKLVAQEFNVMPYISVAENIATHLSRNNRSEDASRVEELLAVVALEPYRDTKVKNLSGGQKQRVALAKALANTPEVILLDEPFSNIDTFRKNKLRRNLYGYLKTNNIACITSTHDSNEALSFADTILILRKGRKEKMGTPQEIISNITTPYQAGFFGSVSQVDESLLGNLSKEGMRTLLPHQLKISETHTSLSGIVSNSYFKGHFYELEITSASGTLFINNPTAIVINTKVFVALV
ncbi:MAG: iron(III) transport system ATP-binding protein [Patiriisocius sp.]|jgi:ABC-type sulfate/molybdate transport systems ATPase subunit